ncbi:PIG-L deacetylase family protein [uncultured Selenomonas sp.]|uniref:PIG-L deacetylase family protein n=1 Tax=uncultured Selenomonas sp. TaxID=159275 RepID=UPI0025F9CCF1|nr:PIG-L deacetylase family protein [uncultured Selenomonas sp.]
MIPIDIREDTRILIVAPHPDDECIGAGGVLAQYGAQCDVMLLTNGCACDQRKSSEHLIAVRREEFVREMALAGVHQFWSLGIEDETLMSHTDCLLAFNLAPYDVIFVASHRDNHPDHQAASACVRRALAEQGGTPAVYEYEIATPLADPSEYLDITDVMERKIALICCHASQIASFDYVGLAHSINAYRAAQDKRIAYAEAYERVNLEADDSDDLARIAAQKQRYQHLYHISCRWLEHVAGGWRLADALKSRGCRTIAIYGDTPFARIIARALRGTSTKMACLIDRKGKSRQVSDIPVVRPDEDIPDVDIVLITVAHDEEDIRKALAGKGLQSLGIEELLTQSEPFLSMDN